MGGRKLWRARLHCGFKSWPGLCGGAWGGKMGIGICIFSLRKWDWVTVTEKIGDWDCDLGFEQNVSWEMGLNGNDRVLYAHSTSPHPGPSFSKGE